jgi:hypothetical protein
MSPLILKHALIGWIGPPCPMTNCLMLRGMIASHLSIRKGRLSPV